jgi:4-hydroxythreonine-4-phosphate dehydrogenase
MESPSEKLSNKPRNLMTDRIAHISSHLKPTLAVTMGDAAGVGPELCLRLLQRAAHSDLPYFPIVLADAALLRLVSGKTGIPFNGHGVEDLRLLPAGGIEPAMVQASCGKAAGGYIRHAVQGVLEGRYQGIVTAPINKESLHLGGFDFPGHTEMLADLSGCPGSEAMLLYSERIAVAFATLHTSLADACRSLRSEEIVRVGRLAAETVSQLRGRNARVGVLALNPHAGEGGLFGSEEADIIRPAIEEMRREGVVADGPLVPDAAFVPGNLSRYDCFVAMYHDQGGIPFKMLAFEEGVNLTMGLPIIRTSPDHGTAFDIAWTGKASPSSFFAAADLAARLVSEGRP